MTKLTDQNPRLDFEIYNESLALIISNAELRETYVDTPEGHLKAIQDRNLIAIELDQDDGFIARVVLGELSSKEKSEWIGRSSRRLNVPDGKLVIAGGVSYISEEMDDEFYEILEIPKGEYFVTVYHQLPSVNGLRLMGHEDWNGFVSYYRDTRSKTRALPNWLAHFADIEGESDGDRELEYHDDDESISFVIQMRTIGPRQTESDLEKEYGFVSTQLRRPKKCPIGIKPVGIEKPATESDEEHQARLEAQRLEAEKRYEDKYALARKFTGIPRFIKIGKFGEVTSYFVPELQTEVADYVESEAKRLHKKAGIGPGPPWIENSFNQLWRDNGPFEQVLSRWKSVNRDNGNLLCSLCVTEENYRGEVRCEFQDPQLYASGYSKMYVMMDLLVIDTPIGPKAAGVSFY